MRRSATRRVAVGWLAVLSAGVVVLMRAPAEAERPSAQVGASTRVSAPRAPVREPKPDRWALVVGITAYRGRVHPTIGGANDARAVRAALLRNGWRSDHIKLLVDGAASAPAIRAGMQWLVARSARGGFAVFHYSGHVKQGGGHEYLWPVDNRLIVDTEIGNTLRALRGYAWLDFAGCEAAGFDEGLSSPQRLVTASSQADEKSFEWPEWRQSVWSGLVFDRAINYLDADDNNDRKVTIGEAVRYGVRAAPMLTRDQVYFGFSPQHPYVAGGDGRDWTFAGPR
ncbi:MAG: caspase domain-containing protein [Mycobacteriales bacterium]|nr:caspase family protein [Frankia sp.]